jgi:hypothetical protein
VADRFHPLKRSLLALYRASFRWGLPWIRKRGEIPFVLNALGLNGEGAEIGVQFGHFSAELLAHWRCRRFYAIDPWQEFDHSVYVDRSNRDQAAQDRFFLEAMDRLTAFEARCVVIKTTSAAAAPAFRAGQLDFVYIDAQHHYEAVCEDLALWRPKVRAGGILAGHDYQDGDTGTERFGVRSAVDELARREGRRVIVTRERQSPSWLLRL